MPINTWLLKRLVVAKSPLLWSCFAQLVLGALAGLLMFSFGKLAAHSFLIGVAIFLVPNAYFTYYAFRFQGSNLTPLIRQSFMQGEMGKLSLVAVGFALALVFFKDLLVGFMFGGFVLVLLSQWWLGNLVAQAWEQKAWQKKASQRKAWQRKVAANEQ